MSTDFCRDRDVVIVDEIDRSYILYLVSGLDDVFVRQDLYDGKYAPDLEQQRLWELETNGNRRWDFGMEETLTGVKSGIANVKEEL